MLRNVRRASGSKGDDSAGKKKKKALISLSPGPAEQRPFYSGGLVPGSGRGVTCGRPRTAAARDASQGRKDARKAQIKGRAQRQPVAAEHQQRHTGCVTVLLQM